MTYKLNLTRYPHLQPDLTDMDAQLMRLTRLVMNEGLWTRATRDAWLTEILNFQADDGSFALVDSHRIESDCRVAYCYEASYLCCALLMREGLGEEQPSDKVLNALGRGLDFCCGRGLQGHGFEAAEGEERAMGWFLRCGLEQFLQAHPGLSPAFTELAGGLLSRWTRVFVYGSLMSTGSRHAALARAVYLGRARIEGYSLYDLGPYPAARQGGHGSIQGELYFVHDLSLQQTDRIEAQGVLFSREPILVHIEGNLLPAEVYLYLHEVHAAQPIGEADQPYGPRQEDLVWYAAYGTNIDEKRFAYYIRGGIYPPTGKRHTGCRDKKPPISTMPVTLGYERYYAKRSPSWNHQGVAFLDMDRPGRVLGRAYLITREQYQDIRQQEGPTWYNREVLLGSYHGIAVRTLTHSSRIAPENAPSDAYLQVVQGAGRGQSWMDSPVF
ncbi:MAG: gamma-glutamylcyclotransferase [Clostridiales bacterium]|nr:gamma-glutamylcyclotransferase [Clostridiales bacterium]